jgi:pimeloyl-ACP methyl ester carboxylesterase
MTARASESAASGQPAGETISSRTRRTGLVQGLRIVFDVAGRGAPTVVLIHSAFASRTLFRAQVAHLAPRSRTLALDLRGHGESDAPSDGSFTVRDLAADVLGVCEAAGVERAVLCGHSSLGGGVALEVAATRPDLVAGVVLLDAIVFSEERRTAALTTLVRALESDGSLDALRGYFSRLFGPFDPPSVKDEVMEGLARVSPRMAAAIVGEFTADYSTHLAAGTYPLLYIHATAPTDLARLRELRPDAMVGAVVGSGHYLTLVVPEQVNAMLDRYLTVAVGPASSRG